ncbi:MAG: hypothetical protein HFE82_01270 [Erysipelotrichaceae bacterium]|nr:hypothetical protein [Erysipelotrichaceae bacterium]
MQKLASLRKSLLLLIAVFTLCACSSAMKIDIDTIIINDTEYTSNQGEYQKIELNKDQVDDKIVICIPEGAVGYSWVPYSYSDSLKLVKEEKITRKLSKNIDGESKYAQQFTFQIEKNMNAKILLKKRFIDDKEKPLHDDTIQWHSELEIVIP